MGRFVCPRCGIVRDAEDAPWCRHGDITLPARRMEPIYDGHPFSPKNVVARAASMTAEERAESARKAARARWAKKATHSRAERGKGGSNNGDNLAQPMVAHKPRTP